MTALWMVTVGVGDGGAGRIDDGSFNGTRVSQRLAEHRVANYGKDQE